MTGTKRLARRHDLCLLGFGGAFLLILALLTVRFSRTGTFLIGAFLKKCLAKCVGLMSLNISTTDGLDIFAVLALTGLALAALIMSVLAARRARCFSRSLGSVEIPPRLSTLITESPLSPEKIVVFPCRLSFAFTAGLFHPRVFISTWLVESLSDEEIKAILRHEHSHLGRRGPLRGVVLLLLARFFFFLPRISRLLEGLRRDEELIADRHALSLASSAADLASALVKTRQRNIGLAQGLAGFAGNDFLGERLSRILDADLPTKNIVRVRRFSPMRLVAGALLGLSLSLLVVPTGAGFLKKSPWHCPHADHASCCSPVVPGRPCSHCGS